MFGDIITYIEDDYFVTHRIVEKENNELMTKGDGNNENDGEINKSKIIGKVIFNSLIVGKFILIYLKYFLIVLTVVVIFINIYWIIKERLIDGKYKNKEIK